MKPYKRQFIQFALDRQVLRFGDFTLKSGRKSPYFFNSGLLNTGKDLALFGRFYADALMNTNLSYDVIFGPAYKGIPIVSATAMALSEYYNVNVPYCFNRKEAKDHGEKGNIIGHAINNNRVMLIDDVITAGTAIHESMAILTANNAQLVGILVSFDRQEKGQRQYSTIQEIKQAYHCEVFSIITLDDLITYLQENNTQVNQLEAIQQYREHYGNHIG